MPAEYALLLIQATVGTLTRLIILLISRAARSWPPNVSISMTIKLALAIMARSRRRWRLSAVKP